MKASEIREFSMEEKQRKLDDLNEELFNLNFQQETGQLENPQKMKQTRHSIARIMTILKEEEINKIDKEE
ncbi:MAG: 50S ribosomal protein L29 [Desulfobacteraceae bacterium]|nr:50S ribosomal protein L29 [Desulfobacteraceae bacterium]MBC2719179.1 50S ribosomal protein L29 [Desulfobacteraceae bacterium]